MELAIFFDHRFQRGPGSAICSPTSYSYEFFQKRYLGPFDSVSIIARVADVPGDRMSGRPSEGPSVRIVDLGDWTGAWGFWRSRQRVVDLARNFMNRGAGFLLIVPGALPSIAFRHLARGSYPFALEVVGDPWDAFSPGAFPHPLRPVLRRSSSRSLRRQCELACGSLYVTKETLQRRYPSPGLTAGISDVVLPPEAFVAEPRTFDAKKLTIITVGGLGQLYKGQDLLIDAARTCAAKGLEIQIVLVGDGKHRRELERRAESAGLAPRVRFAGEVCPASAVRAELDRADLFVLPSRAEGLPRALVEAMARALPCIGTAVGGVPELLHPDDLVAPRDAGALASRIMEVASDRARMAEMSRRNWQKAAEYQEGTLVAARSEFYRKVRERTADELRAARRTGWLGAPTLASRAPTISHDPQGGD